MPVQTCRVCRAKFDGNAFVAREMMLGTRHPFEYWECGTCGSVQILDVPDNLGDYYPAEYFSFKPHHRMGRSRLRKFVDSRRVRHALGAKNWVGSIADRYLKPLDYLEWCSFAKVGPDARVLDVGCGAGKLPLRMKLGGFRECTGIDPRIDAEIEYAVGVRIYKEDITDFAARGAGEFDLIMFHHSLEHLPAPHASLGAARQLLAPGGKLIIRIPVAGTYAWRRYGEHWVQLDPPRHLWLPTIDGMARLAVDTGFNLARARFDSTPLQFTGSELYQRNIPLNAPKKEKNIFDADAMRRYKDAARRLNEEQDGDQALFVLTGA